MKKVYVFLSFLIAAGCLAGNISAQVPTRPESIGVFHIPDIKALIKNLSDYYSRGEWAKLQDSITKNVMDKSVLKEPISFKDKDKNIKKIDPKKNFCFVIFISSDEEDGEKPRLIRIPWQMPAPEPYAARIPGKDEICEIVLGTGTENDWVFQTSYSSSAVENPDLAQLPAFVNTVAPAVFTILKTSLEQAAEKEALQAKDFRTQKIKEPKPDFQPNAELRLVHLPMKRAKIGIKDKVVLSASALKTAVDEKADELHRNLEIRSAYRSDPGRKLSKSIVAALKNIDPKKDKISSDILMKTVNNTYEDFLRHDRYISDDNLKLAIEIEGEYLDLIAEIAEESLETECIYNNVPLKCWSFGLISAYFFDNDFTADRIKLTDEGFYAGDPPALPLTAAIFNLHLKYDPQSLRMSWRERLRFFSGIVLTPDLGFCLGLGVSPLRGLSFNGGAACLGSHVVHNPQTVTMDGLEKRTPGDPSVPFKTKWDWVAFIGIGYNFK